MIWLVGSGGMLGKQVAAEFAKRSVPFTGTGREVDIGDAAAVSAWLAGRRFEWIVNCAAYTAVDRAETETTQAWRVNADGPANLAAAARATGAAMLHFSTDYVFDGETDSPRREDETPNPLSEYGKSKLAGELRISESGADAVVIRISWLYGVHGGNFVATMLRLFAAGGEVKVVCDQVGAPTYAGRLAANVANLVANPLETKLAGVYHYADVGETSWHGFATAIWEDAKAAGLPVASPPPIPITTAEYPTPARRPRSSRLDPGKIRQNLGFTPLPWRANLRKYLAEYYPRPVQRQRPVTA